MVTLLRTRVATTLTPDTILNALVAERTHVKKGVAFTVLRVSRDPKHLSLTVAPIRGGRSTSLDEALEGASIRWGEDFVGRGEVLFVDADEARIVVRNAAGPTPAIGETVRVFQRDFLTPLIDLWSDPKLRISAASFGQKARKSPAEPTSRPLPLALNELRERQREAVLMAVKPRALLIGPPGTGKTYTVGAIAAYLLTRFKNSKILLVGPTNNATDEALISTAEWLARLGRDPRGVPMVRLGSRFDPNKFSRHEYLIEEDVLNAAKMIARIEIQEPSKRNIDEYSRWREKIEIARKALRNNVVAAIENNRIVGITTTSSFQWYTSVGKRPWDFVICDEASQVSLPAALMIARLGRRVLFAGDPNQLAPVVQCDDPMAKHVLSKTAFTSLPGHVRTQLNEQSRMAPIVCTAVSAVFYNGDLTVSRDSQENRAWLDARSPYFIDGKKVSPLAVVHVKDEHVWSSKYSGWIRYRSAELATRIAAEFTGSYVNAADIILLTPFRAQRALIKTFLRQGTKDIQVSTVHSSQGIERKIVIFDPVCAGDRFLNSEDGRRLINVAISRAMNHAIILAHRTDLSNRWIRQLHEHAKISMAHDDYGRFSFLR